MRGRAMHADETIGLAAAARLLRSLGEAPETTVAEQAKALGLRRSTAFVVAAGLEALGLAERDSRGRLRAGPAATRLGLAYYGFGAMADAAEALLPVLRDDTETCVSLIVSKGTSEFEAARRRAAWARDVDAGVNRIEAPIARSAVGYAAILRLFPPPTATATELRSAAASATLVAAALAATRQASDWPSLLPKKIAAP
jgi:DNA-binding IclR family transcriptional regulator